MGKRLNLLTGTWVEEKTAKRKKSPEGVVRNEIEAFLRSIGGYVRTINSGGVLKDGKWRNSGQGSGISDILCWLPMGIHLSVEVKKPGAKRTASEEQFRYLERVIENGHVGCIADSVGCVQSALIQNREELLVTLLSFKPIKRIRDASDLEPLFP